MRICATILRNVFNQHLPIISTKDEISSFPKLFWILQVYSALSSTSPFLMTKELSVVKRRVSPWVTRAPSFCHETAGVGTPLTGHLMVMVVFEAAVTLSPMFIITGLPSPTGISCPGLGTSITGLIGSATNHHKWRQLNNTSMLLRNTFLLSIAQWKERRGRMLHRKLTVY